MMNREWKLHVYIHLLYFQMHYLTTLLDAHKQFSRLKVATKSLLILENIILW